jgi:hypothetical protein
MRLTVIWSEKERPEGEGEREGVGKDKKWEMGEEIR